MQTHLEHFAKGSTERMIDPPKVKMTAKLNKRRNCGVIRREWKNPFD